MAMEKEGMDGGAIWWRVERVGKLQVACAGTINLLLSHTALTRWAFQCPLTILAFLLCLPVVGQIEPLLPEPRRHCWMKYSLYSLQSVAAKAHTNNITQGSLLLRNVTAMDIFLFSLRGAGVGFHDKTPVQCPVSSSLFEWQYNVSKAFQSDVDWWSWSSWIPFCCISAGWGALKCRLIFDNDYFLSNLSPETQPWWAYISDKNYLQILVGMFPWLGFLNPSLSHFKWQDIL